MSYSYTKTATSTFTIIHARYLSSKVAADMHLCAQYYGQPSEQSIREYAEELAQYLNEGYVKEYEFGYKKSGNRVVSWRYHVDENGVLTTDDRAGKVVPYVDITGASFFLQFPDPELALFAVNRAGASAISSRIAVSANQRRGAFRRLGLLGF